MVKKTSILIRDNSYEVSFPSIGQLQDIEAFKINFTNGKYVDMAMSNLKIHNFLLDSADAISYFAVLCPGMRKDLEIKNWRDLDGQTSKELVTAFKTQFLVWFKPLLEELYKFDEEDEESEESTEE